MMNASKAIWFSVIPANTVFVKTASKPTRTYNLLAVSLNQSATLILVWIYFIFCAGSEIVACMDTECASQFSILSLSHIISPQLIDLYWRRKESKSSSSQPAGFEECPFCNFKAIISNENDKIFKCFNPSCLKESCRYNAKIDQKYAPI